VLLLSFSVGQAFAADWTNLAADNMWTNSLNWDTFVVPGAGDVVTIKQDGVNKAVLNAPGACLDLQLAVWTSGASGELEIDGGSLAVSNYVLVTQGGHGGVGTLTMTNGATMTSGNTAAVGDGGHGNMSIDSGSFTVTAEDKGLALGRWSWGNGVGTVTQTGGVVDAGAYLLIASGYNWSAGSGGQPCEGYYNLHGGVVYTDDLDMLLDGALAANLDLFGDAATTHMYITDLDGSIQSKVQGYRDSGLITSSDPTYPVVNVVWDGQGMTEVYLTPEPATLVLLGLGGLFLRRRK
jgi:hypothetical protein